MDRDNHYIKRCIEIAEESHKKGDYPFGSVIVRDSDTVIESENTAVQDVTGHAEINAIKKALDVISDGDLSGCTLYSNFEPCAMCSFVIRDVGIKRVVYSVRSPHLGGHSKWNILTDSTMPSHFFSANRPEPPEVVGGVLEEEAQKIFDTLRWSIHKSDQ